MTKIKRTVATVQNQYHEVTVPYAELFKLLKLDPPKHATVELLDFGDASSFGCDTGNHPDHVVIRWTETKNETKS